MTTRPSYRPVDARDVTAEMAAFAGRGPNGHVTPTNGETSGQGTSPVTETLRARLPRATDVFHAARSGSEALAAALREQDADEERRAAEKLKRAQDEYESYLASRSTRSASEAEPYEQLPDEDTNTAQEGVAQNRDENFQQLKEEAEHAARGIKDNFYQGKLVNVAPPAPAAAPTSDVMMRAVTTADVDRLWDWMRETQTPDERAWDFLGQSFATSLDLHRSLAVIASDPHAAIRSIDTKDRHIGFFLLKPIDVKGNTAVLHVYLAPMTQLAGMGALGLLPYILTGARQIVGPTMNLAMYTKPEHAPYYARFGFKSYVACIQYGT